MCVEGRPHRGTLVVLLSLVLVALLAGVAVAGLGSNPANQKRYLREQIDPYRYDRATRCKDKLERGTKAMINWLESNTKGQYWGSFRCEKWGKGSYSIHAESRAIDWAMDARDSKQRKQAMKLINKRLLATDRNGNENALARRMGIQGIIYDCRTWWSGSRGLGDYSYCFKKNGKRKKNLDPTQAHIDHLHIELSKPGARGKTSFWKLRR